MSTENAISVRQWLEKYHACLQGPKDFVAQFGNDWYDSFFSDSDEMCHRLSPFAKLAEAITDPYILDNYYIWFYEHDLPLSGKPYDDVRFDLLSGERNKQYFLVRLDCAGWKKWSLFSERYGFFAPEFECGNVRSMAEYIDGMGRQFAQGIKPTFLSEKWAVERFIALQDGLFCDRVVYRAGNIATNTTLPTTPSCEPLLSSPLRRSSQMAFRWSRQRKFAAFSSGPPTGWNGMKNPMLPRRKSSVRKRKKEQNDDAKNNRASRQAPPAPGGGG